jgi:hypothetical protein
MLSSRELSTTPISMSLLLILTLLAGRRQQHRDWSSLDPRTLKVWPEGPNNPGHISFTGEKINTIRTWTSSIPTKFDNSQRIDVAANLASELLHHASSQSTLDARSRVVDTKDRAASLCYKCFLHFLFPATLSLTQAIRSCFESCAVRTRPHSCGVRLLASTTTRNSSTRICSRHLVCFSTCLHSTLHRT